MEKLYTIPLSRSNAQKVQGLKRTQQLERTVVDLIKHVPGLKVEFEELPDPETKDADGLYTFRANLLVTCQGATEKQVETEKNTVVWQLHKIAPWHSWICDEEKPEMEVDFSDFQVPPLDEGALSEFFGHIYERSPHIRLMCDALQLAARTQFKTRNHILLYGLPACAKTILIQAFQSWLGHSFFLELSTPALTKAGLEDLLLSKANSGSLPPVIYTEEIEKTEPSNVIPLLQVMDSRGAMQKTNARTGNVVVKVPCVVIATCNDVKLLQKVGDGALWSRFTVKLHCPRPGNQVMRMILEDECRAINGDPVWVDAIISFLNENRDKLQDGTDPRRAKSMLMGGERLMDGTFFDDYMATNGGVDSY